MVNFGYKRSGKCGIVNIFKKLPGIIIVSAIEDKKTINKISFNGGFKWNKIIIKDKMKDDICKNVINLFYRNIVILNFQINVQWREMN